IRDVLWPTQPLAILFHHRAQHLLTGVEAETEERGARVREHVEQGQRDLNRGDGRGRKRFPGSRSCATLPHGGSFRKVVVTAVLPWTAKGAAAPSSARQFNRRRDIPQAKAKRGNPSLHHPETRIRRLISSVVGRKDEHSEEAQGRFVQGPCLSSLREKDTRAGTLSP